MGGAGGRAPTACGVSPSVNMATNYEAHAEGFWEGTKDHDVTQNYAAFLDALPKRWGFACSRRRRPPTSVAPDIATGIQSELGKITRLVKGV